MTENSGELSSERSKVPPRIERFIANLEKFSSPDKWFIAYPEGLIDRDIKQRYQQTDSLRNRINSLSDQDISLAANLNAVNTLVDNAVRTNRRQDVVKRSQLYWGDRYMRILADALGNTYFGGDQASKRLPRPIFKYAEEIKEIIMRRIAWEQVAFTTGLRNTKDPNETLFNIYRSGVAEVKFSLVETEDGETDEKIILHAPLSRGGKIRGLGCIVEGDEKLFYYHGWEENCNDSRPLKPNSPIRHFS